jgi:uncharacterized protein with HEPN domain
MLSEIERDALEDIRANIVRVMRFVHGLDLEGFLGDDKTFYAATRCLEIISEASRRLSPAFKEGFLQFLGRMLPVPAVFTVTTTRMF